MKPSVSISSTKYLESNKKATPVKALFLRPIWAYIISCLKKWGLMRDGGGGLNIKLVVQPEGLIRKRG